jgi:hypothetical protein
MRSTGFERILPARDQVNMDQHHSILALSKHMTRSIILMLLLWIAPVMASEAPDSRLASDVAFTKGTITSLAAKDFAAVRNRLDPGMGQASDDMLDRMSNRIGASEPASIETISATETHDIQTGDGTSRILLEYALTGKWVLVEAMIRTDAASKRFVRLFITTNNQSLAELNAFHLFGKGPVQYAFLAGWLAVIALTALAMSLAFRRQAGWRKWALILLMPLGLTPTIAVNWNTAEIWCMEAVSNSAGQAIPILAFRYPMALFAHTDLRVTYLYVSLPLIAFGYLIWHWWQRRRPLASPAHPAS